MLLNMCCSMYSRAELCKRRVLRLAIGVLIKLLNTIIYAINHVLVWYDSYVLAHVVIVHTI